ncbi:hypothetical protein KSS87_007702 [Heliosperma pusillum]|nr:hypothetical protein KSS87_007702 [Heliosperma pusillum]
MQSSEYIIPTSYLNLHTPDLRVKDLTRLSVSKAPVYDEPGQCYHLSAADYKSVVCLWPSLAGFHTNCIVHVLLCNMVHDVTPASLVRIPTLQLVGAFELEISEGVSAASFEAHDLISMSFDCSSHFTIFTEVMFSHSLRPHTSPWAGFKDSDGVLRMDFEAVSTAIDGATIEIEPR